MAQCINALAIVSEKNRSWIGAMMNESQAQAQVLRQHHLGQQVIAEVIKSLVNQQAQQQTQQTVNATHMTVSEVDEEGQVQDFRGGSNPHTGPRALLRRCWRCHCHGNKTTSKQGCSSERRERD